MALTPGFLKFDGSKWVIDEDIEGAGVNQLLIININSAGAIYLVDNNSPSFPESYSIRRNYNIVYSGENWQRPDSHSRQLGKIYFDTTLGKPIWWNGTDWVDANGVVQA